MARDYDLVLFGASGFTGALTAHYLAEHAPAGLRWAIAGRNRAKLTAVRDALSEGATGRPDVVEADVDDPRGLDRLARSTNVVATTVGPYLRYGEPLVAACARAGTDYADLTGEPEFVDRMYLAYHELAVQTGARLVHACGFDSIPPDLGALFTVSQFDGSEPIRLRGYVRASGSISGGTLASAVNSFGRRRPAAAARRERRRVEPVSPDRHARDAGGRPGFDRTVGSWVLPLPTIDPQIVVRSARALPVYGPDFSYGHFVSLASPVSAVAVAAGAGAAFALAQLPPTRALLLRARPAGSGPTAQQRAQGWFRVRFVAQSPSRQVVTEVAGGDPGYGETAKMLAESALALAADRAGANDPGTRPSTAGPGARPNTAGQVTTAQALGEALRQRLDRAGITFRVLSSTVLPSTTLSSTKDEDR